MVTDGQVRRLHRDLDLGSSLVMAARRAGMSSKTARHYRDQKALPSARKKASVPRTYRTRPDPFAAVWPEIEERLRDEPRLRAKTLFDWLRQNYPGQFLDSHRRTFARRVRQWRATHGPSQTIFFRQVHVPGDIAASDFTSMNSLGITITGQPFDHLVYHFVLTYSNWESVTVCASESFEALSDGLQNALWELGGVPKRHRSDSLSAAVNNLSATREFQTRYRDLLAHYSLSGQRINVRQAHENGDAESAHGHFKTAVEQALLLRGSRDFANREEYADFLKQLVTTRNAGRRDRLTEELQGLRDLPDGRLSSCLKVPCRVDSGSLIHIHRNTYSVHSRLRGELVEARLFADRVEVWYADRHADTLPRLLGRDQHAVHYRHVIDSLVRKPGAFANYAYRDDLFPTTQFRIAYDRFCEGRDERRGAKDYLKILHHAAHNSEVAIDDALRVLLARDDKLTVEAVIALATASTELPAATTVVVEPPDLTEFDDLFTLMEETHGQDANQPGERSAAEPFDAAAIDEGSSDGAVAGVATAGVPGSFPKPGRTGGEGESELPAISGSVDQPRVRGTHAGPHPPLGDGVALAGRQDLGPIPLVALAEERATTIPSLARRQLLETPRERLGLWQARLGKDARLMRGGRAIGVARASGAVHYQQPARARSARCQARSKARTLPEEVGRLRGIAHRRSRLRPTEPRGDGGALHTLGGALRARQCDVDQQLAVLAMDGNLQGPDDHGGGNRQAGTSQRHRGAERAELPIGKCEGRQEGQSQRCRIATDNCIVTRLRGEF